MNEKILEQIDAILAKKGLRRMLWSVAVALFVGALVESQTQFLELSSLSSRVELYSKLSSSPGVSPDELVDVRGSLISQFSQLQTESKAPAHSLLLAFWRFVQGMWVVLPLGWLLIKLLRKLISVQKDEKYKKYILFFGSHAFNVLLWLATILGLSSVLWNKSDNLLISTLVFPVTSFVAIVLVFLWAFALKIMLPTESKKISKDNAESEEKAESGGDK